MELLIFPSIFSIISLLFVAISFKTKLFHKKAMNKLLTIWFLIFGLIFFRFVIDLGAVFLSSTGIYSLPYSLSNVTEIRINDKIGSPSIIVVENRDYEVETEVVKKANLLKDKKYKLIYTPLTKTIIEIKE